MKLIVISGFPKSGTSLLLSLLDAHPQLAVFPEEVKFMKRVFSKNRDPYESALETVKDFRKGSGGNRRSGHGNRDYSSIALDTFEKLIRKGDAEAVFKSMLWWFNIVTLKDTQRIAYVIKEPYLYKHFHKLYEWFGDDLIWIHVTRNKEDNYQSILGKWNKDVWTPQKFADDHALSNKIVRKINPIRVKYDTLVEMPEYVMEVIRLRLGIEKTASLLQPTMNGHAWDGNSSFGETYKGISKTPIQRKYKKVLPKPNWLRLQKRYFAHWLSWKCPQLHKVLTSLASH